MPTSKERRHKQILQLREILGGAYAFVRSRQYTKDAANLTYEELIYLAIDKIDGSNGASGTRVPLLTRIEKIENEVSSAVETVKSQPPSEWALDSGSAVSPDAAVNTPVVPE